LGELGPTKYRCVAMCLKLPKFYLLISTPSYLTNGKGLLKPKYTFPRFDISTAVAEPWLDRIKTLKESDTTYLF